jgi:hypothetical protein
LLTVATVGWFIKPGGVVGDVAGGVVGCGAVGVAGGDGADGSGTGG